jgi:hypothetical protein
MAIVSTTPALDMGFFGNWEIRPQKPGRECSFLDVGLVVRRSLRDVDPDTRVVPLIRHSSLLSLVLGLPFFNLITSMLSTSLL